jgi:hypothetical protein
MPNDPVQIFWKSVFSQVRDGVVIRNNGSGPQLKFETIPNGFGVRRDSPFLLVERWLADNQIHGRSETKDESGRGISTIFVPLTITDGNEASWPPNPPAKPEALTSVDVASGTLGFF